MEVTTSVSSNTVTPDEMMDNTTTFLVGFGILLIFVILGIVASAFLCITLKKDPYLWEVENRADQQETDEPAGSSKDERKVNLSDGSSGDVNV